MINLQISYNWLKKYIDINFTPDSLSEKLTMAGLEVEGVEYLGEGIEDIIIAKIEKIKSHPDADKLVICMVKTAAEKEPIPVVTGAPNVEEGRMVPFAEVGTTLPGGMEIEEVKLRGELSQGMICSKDELGLQEERAEGIMILADDAPLGGLLDLSCQADPEDGCERCLPHSAFRLRFLRTSGLLRSSCC